MHRLRSLLNPIVDGIARVFVKLGFSPSGLTVIGVLVACVAAALIARGMLAAGGVVVLVAGVFDMFDGAVKRADDESRDEVRGAVRLGDGPRFGGAFRRP